jgi:hypothetical protein
MDSVTAKHTPGPWTYSGDSDGDFIVWAGEGFLANVGGSFINAVVEDPQKELVAFDCEQANARLIAAAPELLEACKRAVQLLKGCGANVDEDEPILAAIAKAEGR